MEGSRTVDARCAIELPVAHAEQIEVASDVETDRDIGAARFANRLPGERAILEPACVKHERGADFDLLTDSNVRPDADSCVAPTLQVQRRAVVPGNYESPITDAEIQDGAQAIGPGDP